MTATISYPRSVQILRHIVEPRDILSVLFISRMWCQCVVPLIWTRPQIRDERSLRGVIRVLAQSTAIGNVSKDPSGTTKKGAKATFPYHSLIKRLYFCPLKGKLHDDHLYKFKDCDQLERITLKGNKLVSADVMSIFFKGKRKMTTVDLTDTQADDEVLKTIALECTNLGALNVSDCHLCSERGYTALSSLKKLRRIMINNSKLLTPASVSALVKGCPKLMEINLSGCDLTSWDSAMIDIWLHTTMLRELYFGGARTLSQRGFPILSKLRPMDDDSSGTRARAPLPHDELPTTHTPRDPSSLLVPPEMDYSLFSSVPRAMPQTQSFANLRAVDFQGCISLTDNAIDALAWNARSIRQLTLAKCSLLTDASLLSLCRLGKSLHHLHLGHVER